MGIKFTLTQYQDMLAAQDGRCAACGTDEPGGYAGRHGTFNADHDHDTGEVRGLLCYRCNRGIGLFKDDPDLMRLVAQYLDRYRHRKSAS